MVELCVHCGREIRPVKPNGAHTGWIHVPGGYNHCEPGKEWDSRRAWPTNQMSMRFDVV